MSKKRCCTVDGCKEANVSLHTLPKERSVRDQWLKFIFYRIPQDFSPYLLVCSAHFTADSFTNLAQYNAGFAKKLRTKDTAVPTLFGPTSTQQPGTSQHSVKFKHVGTQTDPPRRSTVGTQLSIGTLKGHVRSKGTQASMSCQSAGAGSGVMSTTAGTMSSSLTKDSRPAKRPWCQPLEEEEEEEEEEEVISFQIPEPQGSTYNSEDSLTVLSQSSEHLPTPSPSYVEPKFIVYGSCLLELFTCCPVCQRVCDISHRTQGTFLAVDQTCNHCHFSRRWKSQPVFGSTPAGNLQLSAATYFTGASFSQLEKIFKVMHIPMFQYQDFRMHAQMYLEPTIIHKWKTDQETLLQHLSQKDSVIIGGDIRAYSPGHSAKYGSYSVMHLESNKIIDIQLVQSNEVEGSHHMELEGLKRSLDQLQASGITLDYIVSDCHPQVQKFLKDNNVKQWCDIFKVAKWKSLVNCLQSVHTHNDPNLPKCEHPDRRTTDQSKWLQPGSKSLYKVEKTLLNKRESKDVEKLSYHHQTSSLEAFHSLIQRFAPKNVVFPFLGMLCRLYLAAMHFNDNADLPQTTSASGEPVCKRKFPKFSMGEYVMNPVKAVPTYSYIQELMELLFERVFFDPAPYAEEVHNILIPEPLSSQYDRASIDEAVTDHWSCFS